MSVSSVDLSTYVLINRFDLPEPTRTTPPDQTSLLAQEVSAVTFNWDTGTLFVVGDGGTSIVQVTLTGQLVDSMTLAPGSSPQGTEFYDPEGLTYVGNGKFVMTEERDRNAVEFTYAANTMLTRDTAVTVNLGTFVGNVGLEGLTYDPQTGGFIFVKETQPQGIFQTGIDFAAHTATNGTAGVEPTNLFDPASLDLLDIADVYALSNIPSLIGLTDSGHLLVLSQESGKIVEVDRAGNVYSSLTIASNPGNPLSVADQQHEGLTMDSAGNLYVVSENGGGDFDHPQVWVYAPSSAPNLAPTALALNNQTTSLAENTNTSARVKVADVVITDDGLGTNSLTVTGPDAGLFEVDASGLYIKAGTGLDFETRTSYAVTVNVDDTAVGTNPDASASFTLTITDVVDETPAHPALYISEVAPWSSGNSPVSADWFEVTNSGSTAIDITGWRMDDSSASFASAVALSGITSIAAGESVIFIETADLASARTAFLATWFGANPPANLQIGSYSGGGVGLSTGGDHVNLFDGGGALQASVSFDASPAGPFPTFDNSAGLTNATITTMSTVGVHGAIAAANDAAEIGSPGTTGKLFISEVAPWSSGDSPVGADWFEITNTTAFAIDITGWKIDDSSGSPAAAAALSGITTIAAGESVIFIDTADLAGARATFLDTWFGANPPANLQIGGYSGSGVGLSTGGDAVHLYNSNGELQASVTFGAAPSGPFATFDNAAALNNATISQLSSAGANGAFVAAKDSAETGSPGAIASVSVPGNLAPTAVALTSQTTSIVENTSTMARIKLADVVVTDDGLGTNSLSVTGADAGLFEVDSSGLYLKAGTTLDFETKASYAVTVSVDDPTVGTTTPDASTSFTLAVTDVVDETPPPLSITEVAPWSSGNSPVGADWFEVTNSGTTAIDLSGWKMDDSSDSFVSAVALSGITSIAAGESVIFIETDNLASARTAFLNTWFGANPPANLQIGSYKGSGVGLSTGGDHVNLFDSTGALQASVAFGASPAGPFATFDNSAGAANTTITTTSTVGVHGAFAAANDAAEIGSPGTIGLVNDPPTITSPAAASVAENTAVTTIVYNADATDPDSTGLLFSLTGDDAARFSIDANSGEVRFLASPEFETPHDAGGNNVYDLVVHANDGVNDTAKAVAITVTNVAGETWVGGNQDESHTGTGEEDNLGGGGGNDTLIGAGGNDVLDGGTGVNTASYTGISKNFEVRISAEQEVITIRDRLGTEGQDTASHVQFLHFADQTIDAATLVDAANLDPSAFVSLIDLYNAYLGRAPDALGLNYWASQLSEGMTLNEIARSFFASDEATDARPAGDSFTAQVTSAYNDILHRAPDAGGLAYWVAELESGRMAPEKFPLAFVMGAHAAGGADAQALASLENIGAYYAIEQGLSNVDHARSILGSEVIDVEAARGQIDDYADAAADPATAELVVKLVGVTADDIAPLA